MTANTDARYTGADGFIDLIAEGLTRCEDGVWRSASEAKISYPEMGLDGLAGIEDKSYWYEHRNNALLAAMANFPPAGTLLDIGGGNGFVAASLRDAGYAAALLEPGESGARRGRARGLSVICSPLSHAGLRTGAVPAAGLFDVLEHIEDSVAALREVHRAMVGQGRLYLTVPAFQSLWSPEDVVTGHFRRYTTRSLQRETEAAGFRTLYATYIFALLAPPLFLLRALPGQLGIRARNSIEKAGDDHDLPSGIWGTAMKYVFAAERRAVADKRTFAVGSTLLAVVEKH